jgi:hypothetical protein
LHRTAANKIICSLKHGRGKIRISITGIPLVLILSEVHMRILIAAAMFSVLAFSPASAMMMACTSDNMAKSTAMMAPGQTGGNKEMAMANMDMSNGKMRSACMHYMKAQKMSMKK